MPDQPEYLDMPREGHYVLGHEAFRQLCEYDPHQFFEQMVSDNKERFINELIKQVELNCPNDPTELDASSIRAVASTIDDKPLLIIEMPEIKAFAECIYVGIIAMIDLNNPLELARPEIKYFTFELGEGEQEDCRMFCQWQGDTHYNLAELDKDATIPEFKLMIEQRLSSSN